MSEPVKLLEYRRKKLYWKWIQRIGVALLLTLMGLFLIQALLAFFKLVSLFFPK